MEDRGKTRKAESANVNLGWKMSHLGGLLFVDFPQCASLTVGWKAVTQNPPTVPAGYE